MFFLDVLSSSAVSSIEVTGRYSYLQPAWYVLRSLLCAESAGSTSPEMFFAIRAVPKERKKKVTNPDKNVTIPDCAALKF